jgi:hypothetical protein
MIGCIWGAMACLPSNRDSVDIIELKSILRRHRCFLSGRIMQNAVLASDGVTYEEEEIKKWITVRGYSPMTGNPMSLDGLIVNRAACDTVERCLTCLKEFASSGTNRRHLSWICRPPTIEEILTYRYEVTLMWNCSIEKQISQATHKKIKKRVKRALRKFTWVKPIEWFPMMYEPQKVCELTWNSSHDMRFYTYKEFIQVVYYNLEFDSLPSFHESLIPIAPRFFINSMARYFNKPKHFQIQIAVDGYARAYMNRDEFQKYMQHRKRIEMERRLRWMALFGSALMV